MPGAQTHNGSTACLTKPLSQPYFSSRIPPLPPIPLLQLCDLYESDCIFDKFDCAMSGDGKYFATGTYSNFFRWLAGWEGG